MKHRLRMVGVALGTASIAALALGEGEARAACAPLVTSSTPIALTRACSPYSVPAGTTVDANGGLTIEAGVTIDFGRDAWLRVKKGVTATGTATSPITLHLAAGQPAGSTWKGLGIDTGPAAMPTTDTLSFVTIDGVGAGGAYGYKPGALVVEGENRLQVTNVSVTHYQGYAVSSETPFDPASNEIIVTNIGTTSAADAIVWLKVPTLLIGFPGVVKAGTGANQVIRVGQTGTFTASATIKSFFVPIAFDGQVSVTSSGGPVKVTFQKNKLLFAAGRFLDVGTTGAQTTTADLVAAGVTFDESVAGAGWGGIRFHDQFTSASELSGAILHAGNPSVSIDMMGNAVTAVAPNIHDITIGPPHVASAPCILSHADTNHAQPTGYAQARITKSGCAPTVHFTSAGGPVPGDIP